MLFYFLSEEKKESSAKLFGKNIYFSETSSSVSKAFLCASLTVTAAGKEHKDKDTEIFFLSFPLGGNILFFFSQWKNSVQFIKLSSPSSGARQERNKYWEQLVGKDLCSCSLSSSRTPQCPHHAQQQHRGDVQPAGWSSWEFPWLCLVRGWMPKESELEGENGCGWKQNHLSTGTVHADQDDPTSIIQGGLQAALAALLDGPGILLLMETTWIPLASYSWDLRAFTGLSKTLLLLPNNKNSRNNYGMT